MERKKLALGVFVLLAVAPYPILARAADVALTSDGKVPGQPFEYIHVQLDGLQSQTTGLQTNINTLQSNYDSLSNQTSGLQTTVGGIQTQTTTLQSNYDTLQSALGALQTQIPSIESSYNSLSTQTSGLQTTVGGIQTQTTTLQSNYDTLQSALGALQTQIPPIEDYYNSLSTQTSGLQTTVGSHETQLIDLQTRVNTIESTPPTRGEQGPAGPEGPSGILGLAGKSCPAGLAVIGFGADGGLICGAPWVVDTRQPAGSGNLNLAFSCSNNFSGHEIEAYILDSINTAIASSWYSILQVPVAPAGEFRAEFNAPTYGTPTVTAQLVDTNASQPCDDAIEVNVVLPLLTVTGTWRLDSAYWGSGSGSFQIDVTDLTVALLANLQMPEGVTEVTENTSFGRVILAPQVLGTLAQAVDVAVTGSGLTGIISTVMKNSMESFLIQKASNIFDAQIQLLDLSVLPAPITINVTVTSLP